MRSIYSVIFLFLYLDLLLSSSPVLALPTRLVPPPLINLVLLEANSSRKYSDFLFAPIWIDAELGVQNSQLVFVLSLSIWLALRREVYKAWVYISWI